MTHGASGLGITLKDHCAQRDLWTGFQTQNHQRLKRAQSPLPGTPVAQSDRKSIPARHLKRHGETGIYSFQV